MFSIEIIKTKIPEVKLVLNEKHFITAKQKNRDMSYSLMERIDFIKIKFL